MISEYLYECHGHIMMDGEDYLRAKERHTDKVDTTRVREELSRLQKTGVKYFRDGGDALGVSEYARKIAPEYGITYATPLFAVHRKGYYGSIVGHGYSDIEEYRTLVRKVREGGGDFIKIMVSGIITFRQYGELSCPHLPEGEIETLIHIAHDAGFPVMIHVNGDAAIKASIRGGADSIEHGTFMEEDTLEMLAGSETVWVPTAAAIAAFSGREGFDPEVTAQVLERHLANIRLAAEKGAWIAAGSDSGAAGVPHGAGTLREYELLRQAGVPDAAIAAASERIRRIFSKQTK